MEDVLALQLLESDDATTEELAGPCPSFFSIVFMPEA
jgi:hypothetical protein